MRPIPSKGASTAGNNTPKRQRANHAAGKTIASTAKTVSPIITAWTSHFGVRTNSLRASLLGGPVPSFDGPDVGRVPSWGFCSQKIQAAVIEVKAGLEVDSRIHDGRSRGRLVTGSNLAWPRQVARLTGRRGQFEHGVGEETDGLPLMISLPVFRQASRLSHVFAPAVLNARPPDQ